jgi:tetratricopeptide (TPR) repeat protein
MAKKKKKFKTPGVVPISELVAIAEERLEQGRADEAIKLLLPAEAELQRQTSQSSGKSLTLPPHLITLRPAVAQLLACAFCSRAFAAAELNKQISDLEEAVKRAPEEARYRLALGLCHLTAGNQEVASERFRQARELQPGDQLVARAGVLELLAAGHTREAGEQLRQLRAEGETAGLRRLAAFRRLVVGQMAEDGHGALAAGGSSQAASLPASAGRLISGLSHLAAGDATQAAEQLASLPPLDHNPSRAEAAVLATQLFYSGLLRFQAQHFAAAAADWREAQRLQQAHALALPWRDRLTAYYHQLAEKAIETNNLSLAAECWRHALELQPQDKAAAANLDAAQRVEANQAWRAGQTERAVRLWRESLQMSPRDERLLKNLAIAEEKATRPAEAVAHWRALAQGWRQQLKSRGSEPRFKDRLLRLEQHLVKLMGQADLPPYEVINELESALKIDPQNHELRRRYADLYLEIGRPQQALRHLETIERAQGESADLLAQKAVALDQMRRSAAARKCYERALELNPAHQVARVGYLSLLGEEATRAAQAGNYTRACEICQRQLEINPTYTPALTQLAGLYSIAGQKAEAKQTIARISASAPDSAPKHVQAGGLYLRLKFKKEAEAEFKRALEIESSNLCLVNIGLHYLEDNQRKQAFKYFERASEVASSVDTLLDIAHALHDAGEDREAEKYIDRALARDAQHPVAHLAKAVTLLNRREVKAAHRELDEAERLATERPGFEEIVEAVRDLRHGPPALPPGLEELLEALGGASGLPPMPRELRRLRGRLGK